tara:strand:+ start:42359 stop:42688 length:330 start_codon:yes stop_codon:yes gene_type:complete
MVGFNKKLVYIVIIWRTPTVIVRVIVFLFVIWGLAMGAVWLVASQLRRFVSRSTSNFGQHKNSQKQNSNREQPKIAAELVSCKSCGIYIPEEEAIKGHNCYYCSDACKK